MLFKEFPRFYIIGIIAGGIYLVVRLISGVVGHDFAVEPVFWIAAVIEVALGFLTYYVYKRFLTDENYKRWTFLSWVIIIIDIGTPITLFYTVDSLEPAGCTWGIYVLTMDFGLLYRIIKKKPIVREVL